MLFKLRVLVKIVLTLVLLDHKLSYLHVLQCSHHSSSFFTIVFISFSPGDPLALGPLPLGYPNGKYNNNNNNNNNNSTSVPEEKKHIENNKVSKANQITFFVIHTCINNCQVFRLDFRPTDLLIDKLW